MAIRGQWSVTLVIAGLWAISLLYGEMFAYWFPIFSCSWPVIELVSTWNSLQLMCPLKCPFDLRNSCSMFLTKKVQSLS